MTCALKMLAAIDFDHHTAFAADEIGEVGAYRQLPGEFPVVELSGFQHGPEVLFCRIGGLAELSCAGGFWICVGSHCRVLPLDKEDVGSVGFRREFWYYFEGPTPAPPRQVRVGVSFNELELAHVP